MSIDSTKMVSNKIQNMNESATIKMAQKARDLASKGVNVISLTLGEPDFDTPQYIKDKASEGLELGHTKYTPVPGTVELRQAICQKLEQENGLKYDPSQIVVSNGAKQSIINIFLSIINPGDEVIVFAPYWVSYFEQIKFCGGVPIVLSAGIDQDFKVSPSQLEKAITPNTKAIIYSSPCNPTGSVYTQNELEALAEIIKKHNDILVISDEIYEYINFNDAHASIAKVPGMMESTAIINGFSKGFAMTGWRLGYMAGPEWLASACVKVQGQVTSGANSFGQYAAAFAIQNEKSETKSMVEAFKQRRKLVVELFQDIPGFNVNQPQGAFYLFPDISYYFGKSNGNRTIQDADDFAELLLEEAHVGTVSGSAFGNDNCIRFSYAASEENLKVAAQRIKDVLIKYV